MSPAEPRLLLTCEHGGNRVPRAWARLFRGKKKLLASHRGWDPGALAMARRLARALDAELLAATTTRLLVDLNRSPHNPAVFSELTRGLPPDRRQALLERHHRPHWDHVRTAIGAKPGRVVHVAVHTFTPIWRGEARHFEIGILYDPARPLERRLARAWKREIEAVRRGLRVRRNAPYRGNADGLTTALRRELPPGHYLGLELELNQRRISDPSRQRALAEMLATTLVRALPHGTATAGFRAGSCGPSVR